MVSPQNSADGLEHKIQLRVGLRVRELRLAAGLTTVTLALCTGISQGQISKIENGKAALSSKVLATLCRVFGRPVGYLFQSREEMPRVLGTLTTVKGPENEAIQRFAKTVHQATGERLSLIALQPCQLGSALSQVEQLSQGLIDLFVEELYCYAVHVPAFSVFCLPYIFTSDMHRRAFLTGDAFQASLSEPLRAAGVRLINPSWNWFRGLEWVLAAGHPITHPAAIKGLKVRTTESELMQRFWRRLGAHPVPVPWTDVCGALRDGDIDVLPTHKTHLYPLGFCRYARHVTRLGDLPAVLAVGMNESRYQVIPPAIQAGLQQACETGGAFFSRHVKASEIDNERHNIRRHRAVYHNPDPAPWRKAVAEARQRLVKEGAVDGDLWAAIEAADPLGPARNDA